MTPIDIINEAFINEDGAGFTVNVWLRGGAQLRNVNLVTPSDGYRHPRDTHLTRTIHERAAEVA